MKVIHISRKQKISRTPYAEYKANNSLKAKYHKFGAFAFAVTLALMLMPISPILAILSLAGCALLTFSKTDLTGYGLLFVLTFNCNYGLGNTGTDCTPTFTAAKKLILMSYYNATGAQNRFSLTNPGTIYTASSSATLTGVGTTFLTTFTVGDIVVLASNTQVYQILSISSNTVMTATSASLTTQGTPGVAYNQFTNIAYWNALVNHPDPTRRILPVPFLKNADNTRADSIVEAFDDNTEQITLQGVRKFMGIIPKANASPQLQGRLLSMQNSDFGMYWVDYTNNLIGSDTGDGFFYPIRIDQNSWMPIYNPGTAKKGAKIELKFDIHSNEIDSTMNAIAASNFQTVVLGNLNGLKDVSVTISNLSHSSDNLTLAFQTIYGDAITPTSVHGLTINNFVSKVTGALAKIACTAGTDAGTDIAVTACTEQPDIYGKPNGTYVLTLTSPSATDVLALNIVANGYDWSAVNVSTATLT